MHMFYALNRKCLGLEIYVQDTILWSVGVVHVLYHRLWGTLLKKIGGNNYLVALLLNDNGGVRRNLGYHMC